MLRKNVGDRNVKCKLGGLIIGEMRRKVGEAFQMACTCGDGTMFLTKAAASII